DTLFMDVSLGMTANGSVSGYLYLNFWPYPENLERLEATAVHELNHNLRYAPGGVIWNPMTVTVGEQIVSEGLADSFARQLYGDLGYARIGVPHLRDDEVFAKVLTGLDVTGMRPDSLVPATEDLDSCSLTVKSKGDDLDGWKLQAETGVTITQKMVDGSVPEHLGGVTVLRVKPATTGADKNFCQYLVPPPDTPGVDDPTGVLTAAGVMFFAFLGFEHVTSTNEQTYSVRQSKVAIPVILVITLGVGLLALCAGMVLEYGFDQKQFIAIIAPVHGFLYIVYVILAVDLGLKAKWPIVKTGLILLAGMVPFVSFVAERRVTHELAAKA
ncbi:DUF3817 domain-containing protein, partial [Kibdelosporangium lantanae]